MATTKTGLMAYSTRDEIAAESASPASRDQVIREAASEFDCGGKMMNGLSKREFIDSSLKHEGGLPKLADSEAGGMERATEAVYNSRTARWEYR